MNHNLNFIRDIWLSEVFGFPVYYVENIDTLEEKIKQNNDQGRSLYFTKINTKYRKSIELAKNLGFIEICNQITFNGVVKETTIKKKLSKKYSNVTIRPANLRDMDTIISLSKDEMKQNRFVVDPFIQDHLVSKLREKWIESYFAGTRGDILNVAIIKNNIAGFALFFKNIETGIVIDLIAIDSAYQNLGIASLLVCDMLNASCVRKLKAGTQNSNESSIRFYKSLNLKLTEQYTVLHLHKIRSEK